MTEVLRYNLADCLRLLGVSRATFYRRVQAGKYKVIKDGSKTFMSPEQLKEAGAGDNA